MYLTAYDRHIQECYDGYGADRKQMLGRRKYDTPIIFASKDAKGLLVPLPEPFSRMVTQPTSILIFDGGTMPLRKVAWILVGSRVDLTREPTNRSSGEFGSQLSFWIPGAAAPIQEVQHDDNSYPVERSSVSLSPSSAFPKKNAHHFVNNGLRTESTMKLAIFASALATAAAFAPAKNTARSTALNSFEGDIGATLPLGFWDPLGLVADGDQAKFDRLRLVEVKHGRIAMLAVVGFLVQEAGVRLPGSIDLSGTKFADIPNGYAGLEMIPYAGKLQLFAFIGFLEVFVMRDFVGGEFPGDLRNDYIDFGWDTFDEATKLRKRTIELNQVCDNL